MDRRSMRSMLQRRIGDQRDTRWTEASDLNDELNAAAVYVAMEIGQHQRINYCCGRHEIKTDAGDRHYALELDEWAHTRPLDERVSLSSFPVGSVGKVWYVVEQDMNLSSANDDQPLGTAKPYYQIDEREAGLYRLTGGLDDFGRRLYYIRRRELLETDLSGLTNGHGAVQIGFPVAPATGTIIQVYMSLLPPAIEDDGDASEYAVIPVRFHEMVVVRAALQLVGTDEARYGFLQATWNDLYAKMIDEVTYMTDGTTTRRAPPAATSNVRRASPVTFGAGAPDG